MEVTKINRLSLYTVLKEKLHSFLNDQIENGIMLFCLSDYGCNTSDYFNSSSAEVAAILKESGLTTDLETIIEFFESLFEENNKNENGIVFTPQYIADYIAKSVFTTNISYNPNTLIIDPGCGCGTFLLAVTEFILSNYNVNVDSVIEQNIYGIDLDENNVRRCTLILKLLSAKHGGNYSELKPNIICRDSLKCNWTEEFDVESFSFIIGNPPYVNPHNMNKETVEFLKSTFSTTQNGVFNIFYAFIEQAMLFLDKQGVLGYIVPNNFLTIKSALELRKYLRMYRYVNRILDFGDNMVFKPVRTYNCILLLSKQDNNEFEYSIMPKVDDIKEQLASVCFNKMPIDRLDKNGWKLVDEKTYKNLHKIESQFVSIKEFIRTGIATLRDGAYLVDCDEQGFYKLIGTKKIYIEDGLVKPIYKIPELTLYDNIDDAKRYIIFPYVKSNNRYILINEDEFKRVYPKTYLCLNKQRDELDSRDKGKGASQGWYAYGRTQGLNKYGKKLLFPTFSNKPHFTYVDNEDALFCNGYAVFENDKYELDILQRILNSRLMEYYVSNTSYCIEGGYYCYQKKYIERFSLPWFTEDDLSFIRKAPKKVLDEYLWTLYGLE